MKGSGANHYPRAPAQQHLQDVDQMFVQHWANVIDGGTLLEQQVLDPFSAEAVFRRQTLRSKYGLRTERKKIYNDPEPMT